MTHFWLWTLLYLLSGIGAAICVGRFFHYASRAEQIEDFWESLKQVEQEVEEARARIR